jgi:hypothetical protein
MLVCWFGTVPSLAVVSDALQVPEREPALWHAAEDDGVKSAAITNVRVRVCLPALSTLHDLPVDLAAKVLPGV